MNSKEDFLKMLTRADLSFLPQSISRSGGTNEGTPNDDPSHRADSRDQEKNETVSPCAVRRLPLTLRTRARVSHFGFDFHSVGAASLHSLDFFTHGDFQRSPSAGQD